MERLSFNSTVDALRQHSAFAKIPRQTVHERRDVMGRHLTARSSPRNAAVASCYG